MFLEVESKWEILRQRNFGATSLHRKSKDLVASLSWVIFSAIQSLLMISKNKKKRSHPSPNHWPRILHQAHQQCENSSSNKVMICNKVQLLISWLLKFKWCWLHHPYSGRLVASTECSGTKISSSHSSSVPTDARWCGFPSHCQPDDQIVFLFAAQPQKLIQS